MKAVILSICPEAHVVDISHEIEKFNIRMGAFILASATPFFPKGAIHLAVVDPGVGTKRRPIIVEAGRGFYVGPDNGLLMLSARKEGVRHVYNISDTQYMLLEVSRTFHGRDIFAPAASHLARGCSPSEFGTEVDDYVLPKFVEPQLRKGRLFGEILYIDGFGNIVTNIASRDFEKLGVYEGCLIHVELEVNVLDLEFCSAYGQVPVEEKLAIVGSSNFLEVAVNQGNAAQMLGVKTGDSVSISLQASENVGLKQ